MGQSTYDQRWDYSSSSRRVLVAIHHLPHVSLWGINVLFAKTDEANNAMGMEERGCHIAGGFFLLMPFSAVRRCHGRTFGRDYFLLTGYLTFEATAPYSVESLGSTMHAYA